MVLTRIIREALTESSLPEASVTYIADTDRKYVGELLTMDKYVDMIIPRGGRALAERCRKESTVPVIVGGFGVSHIFVDETADLSRSLRVIENSKIQRPSRTPKYSAPRPATRLTPFWSTRRWRRSSSRCSLSSSERTG